MVQSKDESATIMHKAHRTKNGSMGWSGHSLKKVVPVHAVKTGPLRGSTF